MMKSRNCNLCGEYFEYQGSKTKMFCSPSCQNKSHSIKQTGEGNANHKPGKSYNYNCETCGNEFKSYLKTARFCSRSCNGKRKDNVARLVAMAPVIALLPRKKRERLERKYKCICKVCEISFVSDKKKTYCKYHEAIAKNRIELKKYNKCEVCSTIFIRPTKTNERKTCSNECRSIAAAERQRGDLSHRWEGGKTSASMIVRNSLEYSTWRKEVFSRDNFSCVFCGKIGGKLNADHIIPFSERSELRLSVDNGRTLCLECHLKTDTFGYNSVIRKRKNVA